MTNPEPIQGKMSIRGHASETRVLPGLTPMLLGTRFRVHPRPAPSSTPVRGGDSA